MTAKEISSVLSGEVCERAKDVLVSSNADYEVVTVLVDSEEKQEFGLIAYFKRGGKCEKAVGLMAKVADVGVELPGWEDRLKDHYIGWANAVKDHVDANNLMKA